MKTPSKTETFRAEPSSFSRVGHLQHIRARTPTERALAPTSNTSTIDLAAV